MATPLIEQVATRPCDAPTILAQIGKGTLMACGARDFVNLGDGIQFVVGGGPGQPRQKIIVKLAANDTYAVEHGSFRNLEWRTLGFHEGIYCDQLSDVIYHAVNK